MYLIVGLGNPGDKYRFTRHNTGFNAVEVLSQRMEIPLDKSRCKARLGEGHFAGARVILAQPQTFMNASGESVVELMNWYKCPLDHMIVIYDDIDLPAGKLRLRAKGSAGTHNGMRNIIYLLGQDAFPRVRIGIGKPPEYMDLIDWVIGSYRTPEERKVAFDAYVTAAETVETLIRDGFDAAMRLCNAPKQKEEKAEPKDKSEQNGSENV